MEIKAIKCAPLFVVGMCEQEEIKNKVTSLNLLAQSEKYTMKARSVSAVVTCNGERDVDEAANCSLSDMVTAFWMAGVVVVL